MSEGGSREEPPSRRAQKGSGRQELMKVFTVPRGSLGEGRKWMECYERNLRTD